MPTETPTQIEAPHEMRILDRTGDTRIAWDPRDKVSTDLAKASFDKALADGYWAYAVDPNNPNKPGEHITKFDPKAEALILAPRLTGG